MARAARERSKQERDRHRCGATVSHPFTLAPGPAVTASSPNLDASCCAQASSCPARDSTESMNSSMISYTTWALVLDWFMVPTIWPTK